MDFAKCFRLVDCILILGSIGYFMAMVGLKGVESINEYDVWVTSTLFAMLVTQLSMFCTKTYQKTIAMFIGFTLIPLCIVSCVMGYFYFYHFYNISITSYQESSYFAFLFLNFFYLAISGMVYIWDGTQKSI